MSGTFEDFLAEEHNKTGGTYSDSVSISLEDLLGSIAAGTDDFDFGFGTDKKDDRNAFQKLLGGLLGGGGESEVDPLQALLSLGLASYGKDRGFFSPDVPVVGYQGEIPKYQAIQEVVKGRDDSGRRPGSGGRRYMSDVIYAKAPENQEPMSVADAQTKAQAQAQGFAEGGDVAAFLQGLGGGEGGGGYQNLVQSMQPQGRAAPQRMQTAPIQPAPMPMSAPSGNTNTGLDMLTLAALLQGQQGQQGGGAQPTEDPAIGLKKEFIFGGGSGDKMPEPDYQVSEDGGIYDNTFYGYDLPSVKYTRYDPETDTYYGTSTNYAFGGKETPITKKGSEAPQSLRDAFAAYERGELKYTSPEKDERGRLADLIKKQQEDMQQGPPVAGGTGSIGGGGAPTPPQGEENIGLGGGIADAMKKMQEQAPKQMPTTDRVVGPPKGQRRRGQPVPSTGGKVKKGNIPVGRGINDGAQYKDTPPRKAQPVPSTGGKVKKGNIPVGRGINDGAQYKDTPPRKAQPAPRRAPTPPIDYSKILSGIGGVGMAEGGYLNGDSDGQADKVPGSIDGVQEARLSHGEYVLPADLVSLLGNGNSDAGAKALDDFMAMVRKQGTGTEKQQKNIKADKVLASLMQGKG